MKVLISGGGTGGHIFPAVSIANEIKRRHPDASIKFVGALGRMEMERVPQAGYEIEGLPVAGFDRRRLWRNAAVLWKLLRSMLKARRIVRTFRPDIAIGVGGYASGPTLKAAQRAGVPTLLQEQNSYAGVTNKLLGGKADAICTAYPGMERFFPKQAIHLTGNPVRALLLECNLSRAQAKQALGFDPNKPLVLAIGGSLGARTINQAIAAGAAAITRAGAQILWQTGKAYHEQAQASQAARLPGVKATTFISDMATAYAAADIVISRAGAGTISELQLLGKATVLVPSPNVAEDHQTKNALALSQRGAALLVRDALALQVPEGRENNTLAETVTELLADPSLRADLEKNIRAMALGNAAQAIGDIIDTIVDNAHTEH